MKDTLKLLEAALQRIAERELRNSQETMCEEAALASAEGCFVVAQAHGSYPQILVSNRKSLHYLADEAHGLAVARKHIADAMESIRGIQSL